MVHPHKRTERIIEDSELPVIQCDYLMLKDTAGTEGLKVFSMHARIFGHFGSSHFGSSRSFSFEHCFLLHLRKPSHGTSRMERDADPKWLGPSYSRAPSEDRKLAEIETKLCGSEGGPTRPFQDPNVKITTARERFSKLEAAMTGMDGPEVESLRVARKRAQEAVQGVPVEAQVEECEAFLTRARSHLDSKRVTIMENMEASEKRLLELRTKMQAPPPTEVSEVQRRIS